MRRSKGQALWVHNHPSGARVVLAPGTESKELAAAILSMVGRVCASQMPKIPASAPGAGSRNPVHLPKTTPRDCPPGCDCSLTCDLVEMRRLHAERTAIGKSDQSAAFTNDSAAVR